MYDRENIKENLVIYLHNDVKVIISLDWILVFDSLNTFLSIKNEDFLCSHSFERDSYIFHVCNYEWMISGNYRYYFYFNCKNTLFVDLIINFCLVIYMNNDYVVHVSFYEPVVLRGRNSDSCRLCLSSCLHCINKVSCFSVVSN